MSSLPRRAVGLVVAALVAFAGVRSLAGVRADVPAVPAAPRNDIVYSTEVVTPHVPWAARLPGGPIRGFFIPSISHGRDMVGRSAEAIEIAFDVPKPARDRMDVRIGEPREDRPSAKVDHPRSRATKAEHGRIAPDRHDPVPGHRECGRRVGASAGRQPIPIARLHGPDAATKEDQVRRLFIHRRTVPAADGGGR